MRKHIGLVLVLILLTLIPLNSEDGEVTIGLEDYISIIKKDWEDTEEKIPVDYTVNSAVYSGVLGDSSMEVSASINVTVIKDGWVTVPLADASSGIISALTGGREISLTKQGTMYYGVFNRQGSFDISLKFVIPLEDGNFNIQVPKSPITNVTLTSSRKNAKIIINDARSITYRDSATQVQAVAVMGAVSSIKGAIIRKVEEKEDGEPVISAELYTLVSVGEGMLDCQTTIDYFVREASIRKLELVIPDDILLHDVTGRGVIDYKTEESDGNKILHVELNFPVRGEYSLYISYEKNLKQTSGIYDIPLVTLNNVMRQKGYVGIQAITNVELKSEKEENVTLITTKELPAVLWESADMPLLIGYKYLGSPSVSISVKRHEDIGLMTSICEKIDYITVITNDGRAQTRAVFSIRNTNDQFLKVKLPDESKAWSLLLSGQSMTLSKDESGDLLLPLEKSDTEEAQLKTFDIELTYTTEMKNFGFMGKVSSLLCKTYFEVQRIEHKLYVPENFRYIIGGSTTLNSGISNYSFNRSKSRTYMNDLEMTKSVDKTLESNFSNVQEKFPVTQMQHDDLNFQREQQKSDRYLKKGALPVEIQIPVAGKMFSFSKTLPGRESLEKIEMHYFSPLIWDTLHLIVFCLLLIFCFYVLYFIVGKFRGYKDVPNYYYIGSAIAFGLFLILLFIVGVNITGLIAVMLTAVSLVILYDIIKSLIKAKKITLDMNIITRFFFPAALFLYIIVNLLARRAGAGSYFDGILITMNILYYCAVAFLLFVNWVRKIAEKVRKQAAGNDGYTSEQESEKESDES